MPQNSIVASKGKIRIDNSDGTFTELQFVMPREIAQKIISQIITWKEDWVTDTNTHLEYQRVEKEFTDQLQ